MGIAKELADVAGQIRSAAQLSGRSSRSVAAEILNLKRRAHMFGVSDYFTYRLFEEPPGGGRKEDFARWRMEDWLNDLLNPRSWRGYGATIWMRVAGWDS